MQRRQAPQADLARRSLILGVTVLLAGGGRPTAGLWAARAGLPPGTSRPWSRCAACSACSAARGAPDAARASRVPTVALVETAGTLAYQALLLAIARLGVGRGLCVAGVPAAGRAGPARVPASPSARASRRGSASCARPSAAASAQVVRGLGVVKDNLPVLPGGALLGAAAFGYLQWAIVYAGMPVYLTSLISASRSHAVAPAGGPRPP